MSLAPGGPWVYRSSRSMWASTSISAPTRVRASPRRHWEKRGSPKLGAASGLMRWTKLWMRSSSVGRAFHAGRPERTGKHLDRCIPDIRSKKTTSSSTVFRVGDRSASAAL